ncbi:Hypothetical predicted protein [Mytilus galloprovincialis]|uniref:Uncharacterized protein n=1 Tax=Mytilus galloprovincialis TaxID=29158 RepID=A0A8B6CHX4_MYTGA|nr:Hypothetical predicted protein [Mytilus galloprovincialis]VDI83491.1 Hypothetical predicted protein [Mytilus galloprovincialis]
MDGRQWGIAMEEDNNTAWVTLPDIKTIQTVDITTMEKGRTIQVPCTCYGIGIVDDEIAVSGYGKIYIISKTGEFKTTIHVGGSELHSISVGEDRQIYFAQGNEQNTALKSVGLDGKVVSISAEETGSVVNVFSDKKGNVYFLDHRASNLKLFSLEDKYIKTILTTTDGLGRPYGLAFSRDWSKLFISNFSAGEILAFSCN